MKTITSCFLVRIKLSKIEIFGGIVFGENVQPRCILKFLDPRLHSIVPTLVSLPIRVTQEGFLPALIRVSIGVTMLFTTSLSIAFSGGTCKTLFAPVIATGIPYPERQAVKNLELAWKNFLAPEEAERTWRNEIAVYYEKRAKALELWLRSGKRFYSKDPISDSRDSFRRSGAGALAAEDGTQKIDAIRINFSMEMDSSVPYRIVGVEILRDYARVLEEIPDMQLWIVSAKKDLKSLYAEIGKLPKSIRRRIQIALTYGPTNPWAQDGSKPLASGRATLARAQYLKTSTGIQLERFQSDQRLVQNTYSLKLKHLAKVIDSKIPFPGGNIIVGAQEIFVGTNVVKETAFHFGVKRAQAKRILRAEFEKPIIELGIPEIESRTLEASAFHIDLDFALVRNSLMEGKKGTVFLNSPSDFLEIALGFPPFHQLTKADFAEQKFRALMKFDSRIKSGEALTYAEITLMNLLAVVPFEVIRYENIVYEVLKKQILAKGYDVKNIPGLSAGSFDERFVIGEDIRFAPLPFYNYTNVIVSPTHILIPQLGIPSVDQVARQAYEALGYKTIPMYSSRDTFRLEGGCRCASEVYRKAKR